MKFGAYFFLLFFLLVVGNAQSKNREYQLSSLSEEYNTRYFFCGGSDVVCMDTTLYMAENTPEAFVVEFGTLHPGEKIAFIYNDDNLLPISIKKGLLRIGKRKISTQGESYTKLSLYFVEGKLIAYLDDTKKGEWTFELDRSKKIGLKISKRKGYVCPYFSCYEPVPFMLADYGDVLEEGVAKTRNNVRIAPHNVGENYNLTFPTDVARNSKRSIRFEYRYEDTKKDGANSMRRARSEISGVFSKSPKNKWIIEYDLYIPEETKDDEDISECITQIHEGSKHPKSPSFCLRVQGGVLYCNIMGDSVSIDDWSRKKTPTNIVTQPLLYLEKNKWYHVKVYLKEGWEKADQPLTKVWVDGNLLFESNSPNCYSYSPKNKGYYNYLKFGIYKSGWLKAKNVSPKLQTRAYVFDNYVVKY